MKINTINVVEVFNNTATYIHAFSLKGEEEAMKTMAKCIRENNPFISNEDIEACTEDGAYQNRNYFVSIMRSVPT